MSTDVLELKIPLRQDVIAAAIMMLEAIQSAETVEAPAPPVEAETVEPVQVGPVVQQAKADIVEPVQQQAETVEAPAPPVETDIVEIPTPDRSPDKLADTRAPFETDVYGYTWDKRIHSKGKTKNADGRWRQRRNLQDDYIASVMAEQQPETVEAPAPPAPPVEEAPAPPVETEAVEVTTLPQLIMWMRENGVGTDVRDMALEAVGLEQMAQIGKQPDVIPQMVETMRACL